MTISNRTRKILWAQSGNLCAICKQRLVLDSSDSDPESVVGDECHIISGSPGGPRYVEGLDKSEVDDISNLMILCRVHHKLIDDQEATYTVAVLRGIKANHELWVKDKLQSTSTLAPGQIGRLQKEMPDRLELISSGKDLFNIAAKGSCGRYLDHSDDLNAEEANIVGTFLQLVSEYSDLADDLQPYERVEAAGVLNDQIGQLNELGFMVFGALERQIMGTKGGPPTDFYVFHLSVKRKTDPDVIRS